MLQSHNVATKLAWSVIQVACRNNKSGRVARASIQVTTRWGLVCNYSTPVSVHATCACLHQAQADVLVSSTLPRWHVLCVLLGLPHRSDFR